MSITNLNKLKKTTIQFIKNHNSKLLVNNFNEEIVSSTDIDEQFPKNNKNIKNYLELNNLSLIVQILLIENLRYNTSASMRYDIIGTANTLKRGDINSTIILYIKNSSYDKNFIYGQDLSEYIEITQDENNYYINTHISKYVETFYFSKKGLQYRLQQYKKYYEIIEGRDILQHYSSIIHGLHYSSKNLETIGKFNIIYDIFLAYAQKNFEEVDLLTLCIAKVLEKEYKLYKGE